jgi:hypothetical protein
MLTVYNMYISCLVVTDLVWFGGGGDESGRFDGDGEGMLRWSLQWMLL